MGADGGYALYKLNELKKPEILRRIQNWFICSNFKLTPEGVWQKTEYGPWVNGIGHTSKTRISVEDWLEKNGFSKVEDLTVEFMLKDWGCATNIIRAGRLPGLSEDLVRLSYGDNVPDEIRDLNDVITRGAPYCWGERSPAYFPDGVEFYPEGYETPWEFSEETWT